MRRFALLVAAALLGAAAPAAAPSVASAAGDYCAKGTGVTVVVDNGPYGGTSVGCDPNGAGAPGSTVVPRAGYPLTYVQRQPGFVCKVAGVPSSASCVNTPPADAYWGLFWSDGKSGTWNYSSVGIGSLKVPAGGFIGWKFQSSNSRSNPSAAPVAPQASSPKPSSSPKPTPRPTASSPRPTSGAGGSAGTGAGTGASTKAPASASAKAKAKASARAKAKAKAKATAKTKAKAKAKAKASAKASAEASASASGSASPSASSDGGQDAGGDGSTTGRGGDADLAAADTAQDGSPVLPWVAAGLVAVLLASLGGLVWHRRRA